jgi:hypothetical protein
MKNPLYLLVLLCISCTANSQVIKAFSQPVETNTASLFIVGKLGGNVLVYNADPRSAEKEKHELYLYDNDMNLVKKTILPLPPRVFGISFLLYQDFAYVFYQQQSGRTVSLMAAKIDKDGNTAGAPIELDNTPKLDFWAQNKIYTIVASENKKYITAFKVNNAEGFNTTVTTVLFDDGLKLLHKSVLSAPIIDGVEFFSEFQTDNEGNFVFMRNCELDEISEVAAHTGFVVKKAMNDSVYFLEILPADVDANDIRIKIDNLNHRYIGYALYTSNKQRNIDGLYCFVIDQQTKQPLYTRKTIFEKEIRQQLDQAGGLKTAFNSCYLQSLHLRVDGGFVIDAGSYYTTNNSITRWRTFFNGTEKLPCGYLVYNPYVYNVADTRSNFPLYNSTGPVIGVGKIVALSFDSTANPEWIKTMHASQKADYTTVGYTAQRMNNQLYYIYNETVRNTIFLATQVVSPAGDIRDLLFKDLEKTIENNMEFLTRMSQQVSNKEIIIPCRKGRYICFAKIEF